ncbi:MAG: hypothetical protein A2Y63_02815 [Candidatus Riflebacteria bacterium RBG_13_59_9]|nr:MAG: hypothetical protein A2Y63_02815 [Candidatus Riflebacteria bacterium RBG_13_59_9]
MGKEGYVAGLRTSATGLLILLTISLAWLAGAPGSRAQELTNLFIAGYERVRSAETGTDYLVITVNRLPVIAILHKADFPDMEARAKEVRDYLQQGLNEMCRAAAGATEVRFEGVKLVEYSGRPVVKLGNTIVIRAVSGDAAEYSRLNKHPGTKIDNWYVGGYWKVLLHDVLLLLNGQEPYPLTEGDEKDVLGALFKKVRLELPENGDYTVVEVVPAVEQVITDADIAKLTALATAIPQGFVVPKDLPPLVLKVKGTVCPSGGGRDDEIPISYLYYSETYATSGRD